jgi:hypothetical protein
MAERRSDDQFRGRILGADGAQPRTEVLPDGGGAKQRKDLQKALGDQAQLDVGVIRANLSAHLVAIALGLVVRVLIARAARPGDHGSHPEVIGVGAYDMDGLLETELDFEAQAVLRPRSGWMTRTKRTRWPTGFQYRSMTR